MQVDLTPNLLDALNDALGLDLQMDDPTVMTMLVTFGEDGSYHMDYDAKALREESSMRWRTRCVRSIPIRR